MSASRKKRYLIVSHLSETLIAYEIETGELFVVAVIAEKDGYNTTMEAEELVRLANIGLGAQADAE